MNAPSGPRTVIPPPPQANLPVAGTDAVFPVHRIYCVGRNYAAHAVEMGHDPNKEPPFFFLKNPDNLVTGPTFAYPPATENLHHEIELVVALNSGGRDIAVDEALDCVFGYAVGLDMTRRDLQDAAKELRRPWDASKAFEESAPCSAIVPASRIGHPAAGMITVAVNGKTTQTGDLKQMIWKVPEIVSYLSGLFTLAPGDLVFTGTPAGVGAVVRGDRLSGRIDGVGSLEVTVV